MSTKTEIIADIQAVADASGADAIRSSLGTPGSYVEIAGSERKTGAGWEPEPKVWSVVVEGLANWLDNAGVGDVGAIKSKLNELIGEYDQLRDDYNNGVVPTTAQEVDPLP